MGVTRREFLQRVGMVLAGWGASHLGWATLSRGYGAVLAAPTGRRLALLVGINQYPTGSGLAGCVTDVELQRELLMHRFGLKAADILTLTDQQATRTAIETAFVEHLIRQARSGDGVVFHFSGLGSTVAGKTPGSPQASLVTAEATVLDGEAPLVNDILEETLRLLLRSLKTDQVTTILDTSHHYPGHPLQGNLRVRAFPNPSMARPMAAEVAFQQQLAKQLGGSRDRGITTVQTDPFPGVVLRAGQLATEVHWSQVSAGLFTYTLTQTLWQSLPASTIQISLAQANQQIGQLTNQQQPQLSGQRSQDSRLTPYFFNPVMPGADGVVTGVEEPGKTIHLWLGGLPAALVEYYGANSLLFLQPQDSATAAAPVQVQIITREGLTARAKLYQPDQLSDFINQSTEVKVGQGVQESVRVLPRHVGLTVALDDNLERIERVDAISALSSIPHISSAIAGERPADCLLSKIHTAEVTQLASLPATTLSDLTPPPPTTISYGLFSQGRDIILNTTGEGGEAIKRAVRRLVPKLQTLLANKWLNLTTNDKTSRLGVRVTLELLTPEEKPLTQQDTVRHSQAIAQKLKELPVPADAIAQLAAGSRIRYRVENYGDRPLYPLLITLNSSNQLVPIHIPMVQPPTSPSDPPTTEPTLAPGDSVTLPTLPLGIDWAVQGPAGLATAYLICSRSPFPRTLVALASGQRSTPNFALGSAIANPIEVTQAILQDLHQPNLANHIPNAGDYWILDTTTWATFRFAYQVV